MDHALHQVLRLKPHTHAVLQSKRTHRGGYIVQFAQAISGRARALSALDLGDPHPWSLTPLRATDTIIPPTPNQDRGSLRARRDSFVIIGVPKSSIAGDLLPLLVEQNAPRLKLTPSAMRAQIRALDRLQRRAPIGPNAGTLEPSLSVRVTADPHLVSAVLALGSVVLDYQLHGIRPFTSPPLYCAHCGAATHSQRHCRFPCSACGGRHPLCPCPLSRRAPSVQTRCSLAPAANEAMSDPAPTMMTGPTRSST